MEILIVSGIIGIPFFIFGLIAVFMAKRPEKPARAVSEVAPDAMTKSVTSALGRK